MSITMEQLTFLVGAEELATYNQHLRFLKGEDVITAKQHKRYTKGLSKYNVDGNYDDMEDAEELNDLIEEMEHAYNQAQRKTKAKKVVKTLTEEEKAQLLLKKKVEYITHPLCVDGPEADAETCIGLVKTWKRFKELHIDLIGAEEVAKISDDDWKLIFHRNITYHIDNWLNDIRSTTIKNTSFTKRADGTSGANHQYYCHPTTAYKRNDDGTPATLEAEIGRGGKQATCVPLNTTNEETKGHYVIQQFNDPDKYAHIESVSGDTNEDGLRQVYKKPMTLPKNPEWKGEGFCKCEVYNKKFNMFLREKDEGGVWRKTEYEAPIICCNGKVSANGKCKRHSKGDAKDWTSLGGEYTCVQIN